MDLKQQENAEKADIKTLEKTHEISQKSHEKLHKKDIALRKAVTQSTLDKIQLAEETARSHEAPGEQAWSPHPASLNVVSESIEDDERRRINSTCRRGPLL